jgi:TRAP-type mannitol/chloroaromatic compound transport system substrate-binding protein
MAHARVRLIIRGAIMDRRTFLQTTGAAAAGAVAPAAAAQASELVAAPALSSGIRALTFATPWPVDVPVFGDAAQRMRAHLNASLESRYQLIDVSADVSPADADVSLAFEDAQRARHPAFAYFAGLPFFCGMDPGDLQAWLLVGGGQALWDELNADFGAKSFVAGHTGQRPGLWAARPIQALADLAGTPLHVAGLGAEVAAAIGARPVSLAAPTLTDALSTGRIAAAEWAAPPAALALGLHRSATHYYGLGLNTGGLTLSLRLQRRHWDAMSAADQAILEAVAAQQAALALADIRGHDRLARQAMERMPGLTVDHFPSDVVTQISRAADHIVADLGASSPQARRIHGSYMAFRKLVTGLDAPLDGVSVS